MYEHRNAALFKAIRYFLNESLLFKSVKVMFKLRTFRNSALTTDTLGGGAMELKDQIRVTRLSLGMTRDELARKLGVSEQSIIWWESGEHRPKIMRINALNEALGVSLDITEKGEPQQKMAKSGEKKPPLLNPEAVDFALTAQRLPKDVRQHLRAILDYIESVTIVSKAKPFVVEETKQSSHTPFIHEEKKGVGTDASNTSNSTTPLRRKR